MLKANTVEVLLGTLADRGAPTSRAPGTPFLSSDGPGDLAITSGENKGVQWVACANAFCIAAAMDLTGQENRLVVPNPGGLIIAPAGPGVGVLVAVEDVLGVQYGYMRGLFGMPCAVLTGLACPPFPKGTPLESDGTGAVVPAAPGPIVIGVFALEDSLGGGVLVNVRPVFRF